MSSAQPTRSGTDSLNDVKPMFSVVTCCYNQGEYLGYNIESVLAQDYSGYEHIVVDDGSTDTTRQVCERYEHVKYIYQENAGQSAALNRGLGEARGEIIAWLNSDSITSPRLYRITACTPPLTPLRDSKPSWRNGQRSPRATARGFLSRKDSWQRAGGIG